MFVSILQLMGLPFGKPIQSRPGPDPLSGASDKPSNLNDKGINRRNGDRVLPDQGLPAGAHPESAQAGSPRRQEVKAQTAKPAAKAKAKAPAPADSRRKAAQPVTQAPAKPVATRSASTKPAAKTQPAAKVAPVKAAAKAAPAKPTAKPTTKPAAKGALKAPSKAAPPVKSAAPAKVTKPQAVPVAPPSAKPSPAAKPAKASAQPAPAAAKAPVVSAPRSTPMTPPSPVATSPSPAPAKAGRPSRLSQITVPSMAQSVASTAAKASYTNTMSSPVLTPPTYVPARKDPKLANNWKTKAADQLSDAEVLAMPDEEYMNDKQMAFFRGKLLLLKQGILSNAGETTEHLRADTVIVPDPADRATIEEEHALELRTRDRERKLLKKIEQSIARIDAGDYGYCDETGEPIGVGRLLARPTATLSLEAQQRRELKQKMFGD